MRSPVARRHPLTSPGHDDTSSPHGMTLQSAARPGAHFTVRDRRVLFLMSLVAFIIGLAAGPLSHTVPQTRAWFELTVGDFNVVFLITRAASLLGVAFAVWADRVGRRRPFLIAFLLVPIGNLVTAVFPGLYAFVLGQALSRIGVVGAAALTIVILAEELSRESRGLGLGIHAVAGAMGTGLALILLPLADRSEQSWRILFALAVPGLLLVPLLNRFLRETRAYLVRPAPTALFRGLRRDGLFLYFVVMALVALLVAAFAAPAFDFVLERLDNLGWDTGAARFLLIVFSGLGTLGLVIGGRMADSIGRRATTVIALLLGGAGGVGFYTLESGWQLAPAILLASLGASMLTPSLAAHRAELFPTDIRARAAGWITNVAIGGAILGFGIGAWITDTVGLPQTISILGIGLAVSALLILTLPETRGIDLVHAPADRSGATTRTRQP